MLDSIGSQCVPSNTLEDKSSGMMRLSLPPWKDSFLFDQSSDLKSSLDSKKFSPSSHTFGDDSSDDSRTSSLSSKDHGLICFGQHSQGSDDDSALYFLDNSDGCDSNKGNNGEDDLTYSSSDISVSVYTHDGNAELKTVGDECKAPSVSRRDGSSFSGDASTTMLWWSDLKENHEDDLARWVENQLIFGDATINSNDKVASLQQEKVVEQKIVKLDETDLIFSWLIEACCGRSGLSFNLKLKGGASMNLNRNEIVDSVKTLVEEYRNPTMKFLIKELDGTIFLVDSAKVVDFLINTVNVYSRETAMPTVAVSGANENRDDHDLADDLSILHGSCTRALPLPQSLSSSTSKRPSSSFSHRKAGRPAKKGKSIRKRIGTVWRSFSGRSRHVVPCPVAVVE
jgi:hypothetical protein